MFKNALYVSSFSFLGFLGQMAFTLSKAANPAAAASDLLISFLVGSIFASGLTFSGMLRRSKILAFLTLDKNWDYDLIFVMLSAVTLNIFTFYYIMKMRRKPVWGTGFDVPSADVIDKKLITGAGIFGAGWGLGGLCPGPGTP
jgi:uncharacterized membrane protein YedE/YeeE